MTLQRANTSSVHGDLIADLWNSLRNYEFWAFSSWLGIVTKYRRSSLGFVWLFAPPVAYIYGIGYFYSSLFGREQLPFQVHLGIGYLLWRMVTQVIGQSSATMLGNRAFILDGRTRFTDYLMQVLVQALFYQLIAMMLVVPLLFMLPGVRPEGLALLAVSMPVFYLNVLWLSVVVGVVGARYPDIHELSNTIFIFGFLLTPIVWSADMAPVDSTRGFFARINPAFHLIEFVRAPLVGETLERGTLIYLAAMTVGGWLLAAFVYRRYSRYVAIWI